MSEDTIKSLEKKLEKITNPRERRGYLQSTYDNMIGGAIYNEEMDTIRQTSQLLSKYGLNNHAKKLLTHPRYQDMQYIETFFKDEPQNTKNRMLNKMEQYGKDKWWLSADVREQAAYQIFEDVQLIKIETYVDGLSELLDRKIWLQDILTNKTELSQEVLLAKEKIKNRPLGIELINYKLGMIGYDPIISNPNSIRLINEYIEKNTKK